MIDDKKEIINGKLEHDTNEEIIEPSFFKLEWKKKLKFVTISILKVIGLLAALYFFICSLDIMSLSFRLVGGKSVTEFFRSDLIENPLAGLMFGIVVTVVVQSSSTSTSIIVSMVAAELLDVRVAVPIIYGCNIGTSVTSTLVSLGHMGNKEEFRRAFAAAIIHDVFNFLTVIILLPLELVSRYSETISGAIVKTIEYDSSVKEPELLTAITKPLTQKIVQLDKVVLELIAQNKTQGGETLLKHVCKKTNIFTVDEFGVNTSQILIQKCDFLFEPVNLPEWAIGLILLIISLFVLCFCLISLVKVLSSIFKGHLKNILVKTINSNFPGVFRYLTPYVAIALGCGLTILVQSSSVFTSSLVPLTSMGLITLERAFPLILGSNIGTTITGILAAFSSSGLFTKSLQIALCHTLFNVTGILIWYPIPPIRRIPIRIATFVSSKTERYRWIAMLYIITAFLLVPLFFFAISVAGTETLATVLTLIVALVLFILIVNVLQNKKPNWLPKVLRTWDFLPEPLRSLEPYDKIMMKYVLCCKKFKAGSKVSDVETTKELNHTKLEMNSSEQL